MWSFLHVSQAFHLLLICISVAKFASFYLVSCQYFPVRVSARQIPAFILPLSDRQLLTERFVWAGLTLFQRLCSSSLWKRANSLRSWMLVSSFHSSSKATPSTTTEPDSAAVIRITFGPDGHSLTDKGRHGSLSDTHCLVVRVQLICLFNLIVVSLRNF